MDLIKLLVFLASGIGQFVVVMLILALILPEWCIPFLAWVFVIGFVFLFILEIVNLFKE